MADDYRLSKKCNIITHNEAYIYISEKYKLCSWHEHAVHTSEYYIIVDSLQIRYKSQ